MVVIDVPIAEEVIQKPERDRGQHEKGIRH
jgi:hypothetical protein